MTFKPLKIGGKIGGKTLLVAVEIVMVVLALLVVCIGTLMWRLNSGPIEVGFARKFIESELSDPAHGVSLEVGQVFLAWSALESRPQVTLRDVRLLNTAQDKVVLSFESAAISVSRTAMLVGRLAPRTIVISKPLITLIREEQGGVRLALKKTNEKQSDEDFDVFPILDDLIRPYSDMPRSWPLRSLRTIMIEDARMIVEDHVLDQSWLVPKIELAFRRGNRSVVTAASLWLEDGTAPEPSLKAEAAYLGRDKGIAVDMVVNDLRAPFLASKLPEFEWLKNQDVILDGKARARLGPGMIPTELQASLESHDGMITVQDVYDHPIAYKSMRVNVLHDAAKKTFTLQDSAIVLTDEFIIGLEGQLTRLEDGTLRVPVRIHVPSLPQAIVKDFWPSSMRGKSAEKWALHRLSEGRLRDTDINTVIVAKKSDAPPPVLDDPMNPSLPPSATTGQPSSTGWLVDMESLNIAFNIENMKVDYRNPLLPLSHADGKGVYDYATDTMSIDVLKGEMGDLTVEGGKVVVTQVYGKGVGEAIIDADLRGPLQTILRYISTEPIRVKIPTELDRVEGDATLKVNVTLPTLADLPADSIKVTAEGNADKVLLPKLVRNLDVTGGPVSVKVKDGRVDVSGQGRLDGRDADFTYVQFFEAAGNPYSGQIVADLNIDLGLREKFGVDLSDWMEGSVPAKITYTEFGGGKTEIDAEIDATPAMLMVKAMNYTKPPGIAAKASAKAILEKGALKEIRGLTIETPDAKIEEGKMVFAAAALLKSGNFPKTKLKETDVALAFDIAADKTVNLSVTGAFLDGTPFLENDKKGAPYDGPALVAKVKVAKLATSEDDAVTDAKIYVDMDNKGDLQELQLDSKAGTGALAFRYMPDFKGNKKTLRIQAEDAGAALDAFGVYENVRGGKMVIAGESKPGGDPKIITGKAEMTDFRVVKAPVLARLVNALSLPGIMQLLGSDGISFSRLEADFAWDKRRGGDMIMMSEGRTSGSSMGLTFEGNVDRIEDVVDINGTIVPMTLVNDVLGSIPVLGTILSGGSEGGVFAATYTVRGPAKNPTTSVNPLAVLTPGFLRRIFFE